MRLTIVADTHVPVRARDLPAAVWEAVAGADAVLVGAGQFALARALERALDTVTGA